ncbi:MAG: 2-polyprenylphenol 6-hydroxylase [Betaproteobacteria bacterium]|nr:2-polyprenylphenol 6-hydroxylase [Betaproteobacteria bacterium]
MRRALTIIFVVLRFRLDGIVFPALPYFWARVWRRVFLPPKEPPPEVRLRRALEYLGPIFVKFGQALSTRADLLPPPFVAELSKLQDRVPPNSPQQIQAALRDAYRQPLEEIFSEFDESPAGSASVAQVHRARLAAGGAEVAVKILRPGVLARINRDLRLMESFAAILEFSLKDGRRLRLRAVVEEFARHLDNETRLLREASNCAQIKRNLAASPLVAVPEVHWEYCRDTVMVMEYLRGVPVSDINALRAAGVDLPTLAKNGVELFFTQVFRDSLFHADMHPGNVHADGGGRFVLLDFGIVGSLNEFDREYLARNFIAFFNRDYRAVAQMHVDAGWTPPDTPVDLFESDIRAVCEPVFAKPLKEISFGRLLLQMFRVARRFELEVQPQLLLLQKTLFNVEGMGRRLDPDINLWDTAKPFLESWAKRQYSPRRAARILRRQAPDWLAILNELPRAARIAMRPKPQNDNALRNLKRSRRRWRLAAAVAAAAAAFFYFN